MGPTSGSPDEKRESEDKYSANRGQRSTTHLAFAIMVRHRFSFELCRQDGD